MQLSKKQNEYIVNATHRWNIKSGAVRSGKSYVDTAFVVPFRIRERTGKPGLNVILGVSKESIERNVLQPMREIYTEELIGQINNRNVAMICGEEAYCLGAEKVSQVAKIQGASIKYCYGDEIAKWNKEVFQMLKSRLDKPYSCFDGACNPEHPTHWLKEFLDNDELDIYLQRYTIFDNPFLPQEFVEQLTNSGLRKIDYASGRADRVDVAARRAVMTAVSQITGKISEYNAQKLGTEYFEVEWHAGARPTHAVWQGRVWSKQQLYSVCGLGTVTGLLGVNCYHTYYPFFPGLSERNWSDEWLDAKNLEESEPKKFGDKEYTLYEAKQKQRRIELAMRAQREKVRLLQKGKANPDEILLNKAKYQGQLNEYFRFCRKMKLTEERERIYLDMKGRVATNSKRQNALFPPEMIENASKDVAQYKRYKEVLGDSMGSLVNFGQMKYNDSEKWKIISEAYTDVKWQSQALKKKQIGEIHSIPYKGTPNSVFDNFKDGALQRRRYYGNDGRPRLDIDMTDHGNSKEHPIVPHYHNWYLDEKGNLKREAKHDNPLKLGHEIANKDILEKR